MKITKSQLKEIIKEEVSRLQKKTILENRKKEIVRELGMLNEEVEGDKSILETLYIKLPFLKDGTITEDEWSFLKKYDEFLNDVNSKEDYINYLSKVSDESYDQENIETLHSYKAFDTLEDAVKLIVKEINPKFHVWFSENVELRDGNDKNVLTISDENDNLTKIPVTAKLKELNEDTMKITKSQLKEIIKEEVSRLQKKTILENRKDAEKQVYLSQTQINLAINTLEEVSRQLKNPELVTLSDQRELYIDATNARKALSIAQHNQIYKNPKNSLDNMFKGTTPDDIDF